MLEWVIQLNIERTHKQRGQLLLCIDLISYFISEQNLFLTIKGYKNGLSLITESNKFFIPMYEDQTCPFNPGNHIELHSNSMFIYSNYAPKIFHSE